MGLLVTLSTLDIKENFTDFTHQSLVTGIGEYCCICVKPFVAQEEAV